MSLEAVQLGFQLIQESGMKISKMIKAVKVTVNRTESHVLLHHDLRGTRTLTSRLHSSEKGDKGWSCGFHYTINSSQLVSGILPNLHRDFSATNHKIRLLHKSLLLMNFIDCFTVFAQSSFRFSRLKC